MIFFYIITLLYYFIGILIFIYTQYTHNKKNRIKNIIHDFNDEE